MESGTNSMHLVGRDEIIKIHNVDRARYLNVIRINMSYNYVFFVSKSASVITFLLSTKNAYAYFIMKWKCEYYKMHCFVPPCNSIWCDMLISRKWDILLSYSRRYSISFHLHFLQYEEATTEYCYIWQVFCLLAPAWLATFIQMGTRLWKVRMNWYF